MKKITIFSQLLLLGMFFISSNLFAEPCPFVLKVNADYLLCSDGITTQKYTCKTIEWDEEINGTIYHRSTIIAIFYCCNWNETTKTLDIEIHRISFWGYNKTQPPFLTIVNTVINELLSDSRAKCWSSYPACDDPNIPKKFEQKITFPICWYYENSQPFVGDDFILSLVKCDGSYCVTTYEVCTDYSQIPYKIVETLVSKVLVGTPCTTNMPLLPPETSPVWQQNWVTGCFLLNNCD